MFAWMFKSCKNLNTLDISSFDMSNAMLKMNMFTGLSNLQTLVLGQKCVMANTGLDTPGKWASDSGNIWTSAELMNNYDGSIDYGTYDNDK
ncbi:hypothetical protein SDC49_02635 [Lactobacillus sp. R2/2]|nr:hypothetical protein [Lactobacillus sp. R2/2]